MNKLIPLAAIAATTVIGSKLTGRGRRAEDFDSRSNANIPEYDFPQLAYYDGMRGLIPVKALGWTRDHYTPYGPGNPEKIQMVVTAARPGYPQGYKFGGAPYRVVPRDRISQRKYTQHVLPYRWKVATRSGQRAPANNLTQTMQALTNYFAARQRGLNKDDATDALEDRLHDIGGDFAYLPWRLPWPYKRMPNPQQVLRDADLTAQSASDEMAAEARDLSYAESGGGSEMAHDLWASGRGWLD